MQVLHYADEVRSFDEVPVGDAAVKDTELKLATQLIDQISVEDFNPHAYEDEVKKRYQEAIQRKVEGQEITAAEPEAPKGQIIDLMEALKASLARSAKASEEEKKPAARKAARAEPKARRARSA
jgi:DNA end-binding protein Ku